jgi:hypothetical protein
VLHVGSGWKMGTEDTTRLLHGMGREYPDNVQIGELLASTGLDGARAVRAIRGLFEGGLITAWGSPCADGLSGSELLLTEPGMLVAFGLACVAEDPRGALAALEAETLRQLHRHRQSR